MKKGKKERRGKNIFLTFQVHDVSAVDTAETKALMLAHCHFHLDRRRILSGVINKGTLLEVIS